MKKIYIFTFLLVFNNISAFASQSPTIPSTLKEMIETSDLIVTGKLGAIISREKFYGYQKNAEDLEKFDALSNLPIALIAVDYELDVDTVIYNKSQQKNIEENISYRIIQSQFVKNSTSRNDENYIFFLSKVPVNGNRYSVKSTIYKLQMNGVNPVSYSSGNKQIMLKRAGNKENLSSVDFLEKVIELSTEINKKNTDILTLDNLE